MVSIKAAASCHAQAWRTPGKISSSARESHDPAGICSALAINDFIWSRPPTLRRHYRIALFFRRHCACLDKCVRRISSATSAASRAPARSQRRTTESRLDDEPYKRERPAPGAACRCPTRRNIDPGQWVKSYHSYQESLLWAAQGVIPAAGVKIAAPFPINDSLLGKLPVCTAAALHSRRKSCSVPSLSGRFCNNLGVITVVGGGFKMGLRCTVDTEETFR